MTTRKDKLKKALAFDGTRLPYKHFPLVMIGEGEQGTLINEYLKHGMKLYHLESLHAALIEAVEALEMGAFHHPSCGWYDGKNCHCANSKCKEALSKIDKVLADLKE